MIAIRRRSLELAVLALAGFNFLLAAGPGVADLLRCARALPCLLALTALAESLPGASKTCPVTGLAYRRTGSGISCADPERHLGLEASVDPSGPRLSGPLPPFDSTEGSRRLAVPGGRLRVSLDLRKDRATVLVERGPALRKLYGPAAIAVGIVLFILGAARGPADRARLGPLLADARDPYRRGALLKEGVASVLISVVLMAAGGFSFAWGLDAAAGTRRAVFHRDGRAEFQDLHFGRKWTKPDLVPRITAVLPASAFGGRRRLYAFYAKDGAIRQRFVATVAEQDLGVLAVLNAPGAP